MTLNTWCDDNNQCCSWGGVIEQLRRYRTFIYDGVNKIYIENMFIESVHKIADGLEERMNDDGYSENQLITKSLLEDFSNNGSDYYVKCTLSLNPGSIPTYKELSVEHT